MSHLHSRLFGLLFCAPDAFQHTNLRYCSCQVCVTVEEMQDQDTMNMEGDHPCTVFDVPAKRAKVHADVMDGPRDSESTLLDVWSIHDILDTGFLERVNHSRALEYIHLRV